MEIGASSGGLQSTEYPDYATVSNRLNFANLVLTFQIDSFVLRCTEYGEIFASERLKTRVSVHRSTGELYKSSRGSCRCISSIKNWTR